MNNDYFKSVLFKGWRPQLSAFGNSAKNVWLRADDLGDRADIQAHVEMMLDTDMCLAYSRNNGPNNGQSLSATANANGCCAWVDDNVVRANNPDPLIEDYCGRPLNGGGGGGGRGRCCNNDITGPNNQDCDDEDDPTGVALNAIERMAKNEAAFLSQLPFSHRGSF